MNPVAHRLRRLFASATPLGAFLVGTVVLALWLGYQALDAALSHRRTAEAVLSDYARISATEMAQVVDNEMDDLLDDLFRTVSREANRRRGTRSAGVLLEEMDEAMDHQRCDCPDFRDPLAVFRLTPGAAAFEILPDTLPPALTRALLTHVLAARPEEGEENGLFTLTAGQTGTVPLGIGFGLPDGNSGDGEPSDVYGFVIGMDALAQLFQEWYEEETLLPEPIAGEQPNDSLLHVTIARPDGGAIFQSPVGFATQLSASVPVASEFGSMIVTAAVRPESASQLVIGGLPRSRLPLLSLLLMLTIGVSIAAAVQLRREQTFQRLRDDFVSGVSHELRTPLAQIRMFAELQQDGKLLAPRDAARATFVIHREAVRLSHLVENILQFSRLRRLPDQRLPTERLNFAGAFSDGIDALAPLLHDRGMNVALVAEPDLEVVANREALTRIIVNLLDNAIKYGPNGQTIAVRVERVQDSARLSVSDQGPGVPERDRPKVWRAYFRLERDVSSHIAGSGIGLSVVADLVALHGGRAWVEDALPTGSRFVIEIPLAVGIAPEGSAAGAPSPAGESAA